MTPDQAVRQIRNIAFKPGWRLDALALGDREHVAVTYYIDTVDSSYPGLDGICRRQVTLERPDIIDVTGLDEAGLCHRLLKLASAVDEHENREFMKVRQPDGSWATPLHPHTDQGNSSWRTLEASAR